MKGEAQNFKWFKDRIFEIPFFQSTYVWKEDNWEELWNNIVLNSTEEMPFIGSFILQIKDDRGLVNYIVIDGQQRLTTLLILIKAFLDSSSDLKNDDEYSGAMNEIESYIMNIEHKCMKTSKHPRVTPSSIDKRGFLNVMEGNLKLDDIVEDSHNILRCYSKIVPNWNAKNGKINKQLANAGYKNLKIGRDGYKKIFDTVYKDSSYDILNKGISYAYDFITSLF